MSLEENKATFLLYVHLFNAHDIAGMEALFHQDAVDHSLPLHMQQGRGNIMASIGLLFRAFPDISLTVEDMLAEGDKISHRVTLKGTHKGDFMGKAPTGMVVEGKNINIVRFVNGQMFERWSEGGLKL